MPLSSDGKGRKITGQERTAFPSARRSARKNGSTVRSQASLTVVPLAFSQMAPSSPPGPNLSLCRRSRAMSGRSVTRSGACGERSVTVFVRSPHARRAAHITVHARGSGNRSFSSREGVSREPSVSAFLRSAHTRRGAHITDDAPGGARRERLSAISLSSPPSPSARSRPPSSARSSRSPARSARRSASRRARPPVSAAQNPARRGRRRA